MGVIMSDAALLVLNHRYSSSACTDVLHRDGNITPVILNLGRFNPSYVYCALISTAVCHYRNNALTPIFDKTPVTRYVCCKLYNYLIPLTIEWNTFLIINLILEVF